MVELARATEFIRHLSALGSIPEVLSAFEHHLRSGGFENFAICDVMNRSQPSLDRPILATNYPMGWRSRYKEQDYFKHDALLFATLNRIRPFRWSEIQPHQRGLPARIFCEARAFRHFDGVCVPVHRAGHLPGMIALPYETADFGPQTEEALTRICVAVFARLESLQRGNPLPFRPLSGRETDILNWIAAGKSTPVIADILGLSDHTIRGYVKAAMRKLNAATQAQAVALGLRTGQLVP